jgi:Rrf2 family iron-sulfur cluster assembly transcriptional regulator
MLDLAIHDGGQPTALSEISARQGISLSYLEQLFSRLRKRGLVSSARGPGGGYRLGMSAEEISIADVIGAVDESVDATKCGGEKNCHGDERCLTHELWVELSDQIHGFLDGICLDDLVKRQSIQSISQRQNSTIIESVMFRKEVRK